MNSGRIILNGRTIVDVQNVKAYVIPDERFLSEIKKGYGHFHIGIHDDCKRVERILGDEEFEIIVRNNVGITTLVKVGIKEINGSCFEIEFEDFKTKEIKQII
ncbi:hypothetical protein [Clostridium frigidicarnis]|uniref:Uncharacterized protein n=1 Tax=Clostridium frigidicarnis TaxID=84698 RepID=A0A1I0V218_9CLOT|nr:hypothetical protein [Clostridium frigidicarnis]SFA70374.1 hypothetical protein SAMN04488528_1001104 [Clostridium frigidicarnis]